jgi:hypothetical protein
MLYHRDFATLAGAACARAALRASLLTYASRDFHIDRDARAFADPCSLHGAAAGKGAKSFAMINVQPAGSSREISRPPRFEKGG